MQRDFVAADRRRRRFAVYLGLLAAAWLCGAILGVIRREAGLLIFGLAMAGVFVLFAWWILPKGSRPNAPQ